MKKPLSKSTKFSIWVATCVSIGIIFGLIDGKSIKAGITVALIVSVIMVVGFIIVALQKKKKN